MVHKLISDRVKQLHQPKTVEWLEKLAIEVNKNPPPSSKDKGLKVLGTILSVEIGIDEDGNTDVLVLLQDEHGNYYFDWNK